MSIFVSNALLGGGVSVWIREQGKINGTTKPLMANLDITLFSPCAQVRTVNVYYSNRTVQNVIELKNK